MKELILIRSDGVKLNTGKYISGWSSKSGRQEFLSILETPLKIEVSFSEKVCLFIYPEFHGTLKNTIYFSNLKNNGFRLSLIFDESVSLIDKVRLFSKMHSTFQTLQILEREKYFISGIDQFLINSIIFLSKVKYFEVKHSCSSKIIYTARWNCGLSLSVERTQYDPDSIKVIFGNEIIRFGNKLDGKRLNSLLFQLEKRSASSLEKGKYLSFIGKILVSKNEKNKLDLLKN